MTKLWCVSVCHAPWDVVVGSAVFDTWGAGARMAFQPERLEDAVFNQVLETGNIPVPGGDF